ncbi:MAG: protein kinase [Polyangiaceae bacterium]|nr:protein kinase [Polyangiaceae bacterium]MCW5789830.1 protein kinase [Polyangiaceae bacterium]
MFDAEHLVTGASVAIKLLLGPSRDVDSSVERLRREGRVIAALKHPNVVLIHDAGRCATHGVYLVLEKVVGRSLESLIAARGRLAPPQAVALAVQLSQALGAAHRQQVIHRDVKPSNLIVTMVGGAEVVKLIDFGIAQVAGEAFVDLQRLTTPGQVIGTVEYISPECWSGDADARSDVYAMGVLLYEALTGQLPFTGTAISIMARVTQGAAPARFPRELPGGALALEAVVLRAMQSDPSARYDTPGEFARACLEATGPLESLSLLSGQEGATGRRRFVRAPYVTPVRIVTAEGTVDGRTIDLSEGGALILGAADCSADQRVQVKLPLPISGRVLVVEAITRWVKLHHGKRALGVEFLSLPEAASKEIVAYVGLMASSDASAS